MTKKCGQCLLNFEVTESDQAYYVKIDVPPPQTCPKCRFLRRLVVRNARTLYYRKCDFSGREIISMYHEGAPFPVYAEDIWFSDQWDALEYGRDFDFSRPFFEQFRDLKYSVPHFSVFIVPNSLENSGYTNCTGYLKNCYLIGESDHNEDCYYSTLLKYGKNLVDCSVCYEDELCYECIDCRNCYNLIYSQDCDNCRDSAFLQNCHSCKDCIGCINQRQKQYMVFNKQYTKEEYEKIKAKMQTATAQQIRDLWQKSLAFFETQPHQALYMEQTENSTGDHLYNSKNAQNCFDSRDLEDCTYCAKLSYGVKSCMDYNSWGFNAELVYQSSACGDSIYNLKFCTTCTTNNRDLTYCDQCTGCKDCFGCVGLKQKQYCIFNQQYTQEEYVTLRQKLIEHMRTTAEYGEFFPAAVNPFGYNETIAMDYFPLTREEALARGYTWKEADPKEYQPQTTTLPGLIRNVPDSIVDEMLACTTCQKNYRIITQELRFYRTMNLPVPDRCPTCRHIARMQKRNPPELYDRSCDQCNQEMQTSYPPTMKAPVYCQKCFLSTVY